MQNGKAIAQHKGPVTQVTECQHGACQVTHSEDQKALEDLGEGRKQAGSRLSSIAGPSLFPRCAAYHHVRGCDKNRAIQEDQPRRLAAGDMADSKRHRADLLQDSSPVVPRDVR